MLYNTHSVRHEEERGILFCHKNNESNLKITEIRLNVSFIFANHSTD